SLDGRSHIRHVLLVTERDSYEFEAQRPRGIVLSLPGSRWVDRRAQDSHARDSREQFLSDLEQLRVQRFDGIRADACQIAARAGQARNDAALDRASDTNENNANGRRRTLCSEGQGSSPYDDDIDVQTCHLAHYVVRLVRALGESPLDGQVPAFYVTELS